MNTFFLNIILYILFLINLLFSSKQKIWLTDEKVLNQRSHKNQTCGQKMEHDSSLSPFSDKCYGLNSNCWHAVTNAQSDASTLANRFFWDKNKRVLDMWVHWEMNLTSQTIHSHQTFPLSIIFLGEIILNDQIIPLLSKITLTYFKISKLFFTTSI